MKGICINLVTFSILLFLIFFIFIFYYYYYLHHSGISRVVCLPRGHPTSVLSTQQRQGHWPHLGRQRDESYFLYREEYVFSYLYIHIFGLILYIAYTWHAVLQTCTRKNKIIICKPSVWIRGVLSYRPPRQCTRGQSIREAKLHWLFNSLSFTLLFKWSFLLKSQVSVSSRRWEFRVMKAEILWEIYSTKCYIYLIYMPFSSYAELPKYR